MNQRFHVSYRMVVGLSACLTLLSFGCHNSKSKAGSSAASTHNRQNNRKSEPKPAATVKAPHAGKSATKHMTFTAANNPTTMAGRGAPDLDNPQSPAAWVFIDGKGGKFKEEGGQPLLQWFVDDAVGSSPKFRVEAFEPLLGTPRDFKAVLRTIESEDGSDLVYGIAARDGMFEVGREYSLLNPGDDFVVRNGLTGDEVKEISPLPAGKYAIAAGVTNSASGQQTLAVTYFTVRSDE